MKPIRLSPLQIRLMKNIGPKKGLKPKGHVNAGRCKCTGLCNREGSREAEKEGNGTIILGSLAHAQFLTGPLVSQRLAAKCYI